MHRLILVYTLACANFCSYRDTSATPQSASIKALRNANLRRDEGFPTGCKKQSSLSSYQGPKQACLFSFTVEDTWVIGSQRLTLSLFAFWTFTKI
ncbi:hypothetical protein CB1_000877040 [Camelus ferus]|nr:hypothetical protein CB1_000877040 [Camelus ferus]